MNPDEEIKIESAAIKRPGGQYVGVQLPAVMATHLPTGNSVTVRSERSTTKAKALALSMMEHMKQSIRDNSY